MSQRISPSIFNGRRIVCMLCSSKNLTEHFAWRLNVNAEGIGFRGDGDGAVVVVVDMVAV